MKNIYTVTIEFSVELDLTKPEMVAQTATWMKDMADGKIAPAPEGLPLKVEAKKTPTIIRRKE